MTRLILSATGLIAAAVLVACGTKPHELVLVTPSSEIDREIVEDLSELFDNERVLTRIRLTDEQLPGTAALDALVSGRADIAIVSNNLEFHRDIATVMPLYPTVLHIARRAEHDALEGADSLRNAAIFAGAPGSASRLVFEKILGRTGLGKDDFHYVTEADESAEIVVVFAPISPERVADFPGLILYSFGDPRDIGEGSIVDTAVLLNPSFRPFVIPVGTYGEATPSPVVTIAVDKILVARSDLDSSVVYDLIDDILRLRPALAAQRPGLFQELSVDFDASRSRYILHAGTQAYLQRSAPTVYERYSGIAEVAVTLLVAIFSASFAGIRIFKMRRKNRIDRFYAATIAVRNSVTVSKDPTVRKQGIEKIRELQNEAFDLLVHEKLAADESFRIFITLSNDVLRQLGAPGIDDHLSDA